MGFGDPWPHGFYLSKFIVYWTHDDIDNEVEEITRKSHGFSKVVTGVAALARPTTYYRHLLSARNRRDAILNLPSRRREVL